METDKRHGIKMPQPKVIKQSLRRKRTFPNILQMIAGVPAMDRKKSAKESLGK